MKSRSQTKDHGHWSGNETSTQANRQQAVCMAGMVFSPAALGKVYEYHIGKALHSAAYL